jgi:outer membrane protein assembly factor BamB
MPNHGYASSTPAADGERVYAFFGRTGVVAFDYEGKEAWRAEVAPDPRTNGFGTASSLLVVKDLVIVPASVECEAIVAFDRKTGKEAWRSPAAGYGGWWSTPILVEPPGGRPEIVVSVPGELWGLNPENGKLRWHSEASPDRNSCPSPVAAGGIVYAVNGRQSPGAVAVRLGGRGDVTKTHVAWNVRAGSYLGSPVVHEGHLYWVNDQGVAHCYRADTGAEVYRQRLEDAGGVYASAVLAEGKLYVVTKRNGTFILDARPEFRQLAVNKLAADTSDFNASPAVSGGKVYLRSNRYLYAIGPAAK